VAFVKGPLGQSFEQNSGAWILAVLLLASCYIGNESGQKVRSVCDLAEVATEIPDRSGIGSNPHPTPETLKADLVTITRLKKEDSLQADLFRWQTHEGEKIKALCDPPDDDDGPDQ
jgi:hypothetical protein